MDPREFDEDFTEDEDINQVEWEEDPAFDHLRDEEANFIATEREAGR